MTQMVAEPQTRNGGNGSSAIVRTQPASAIASMADRYQISQSGLVNVIKKTCINGEASDAEFNAFVLVANHYGLNPLTREIHAFVDPRRGIVPIVGIDGWSKIVNGQPRFNGCEFHEWRDEREYHIWSQMMHAKAIGDEDLYKAIRDVFIDNLKAMDPKAPVIAMTCRMFVKERDNAVEVTEWVGECKRNTPPWNTMTRRMIRHKCFMQAGRLAFSIGGIHDEDEARDIIDGKIVTASSGPSKAEALADKVAAQKRIPSAGHRVEMDTGEVIEGEEMPSRSTEQEAQAELQSHDFARPGAESESTEPAEVPEKAEEHVDQAMSPRDQFIAQVFDLCEASGITDAPKINSAIQAWALKIGRKGKEHEATQEQKDGLFAAIKEKRGVFAFAQ